MPAILKVSTSTLPTEFGNYNIHVYKELNTLIEHVALVMGNVGSKENVLVRVHSECLTGDIFSSTRCDCGEQLTLAQKMISSFQQGVLVYLRNHEGRGIGLANKIRAYALQDKGLDTVEANLALGLPVDIRTFEVAAEIIKDLGIGSVKLITNNPDKINALVKLGIDVNGSLPIQVPPNQHNIRYLKTKQEKMGHRI